MSEQQKLLDKAAQIKLLILDVDGVLTSGHLFYGEGGEIYKMFHAHDGLGIKLLQQTGVTVAIITSRQSTILTQRMQELGVKHVYQGKADKRLAFNDLLNKLQLTPAEVAYVGDDLPDLVLVKSVGLGIAVANAQPLLKQFAHWQTQLNGGEGAVREVCEFIMQAQGTLTAVYEQYL